MRHSVLLELLVCIQRAFSDLKIDWKLFTVGRLHAKVCGNELSAPNGYFLAQLSLLLLTTASFFFTAVLTNRPKCEFVHNYRLKI